MNFKNLVTCAALALSIPLLDLPAANANVILTYTGNDFTSFSSPYTGTDKVTATITLANPLGDNLNQAPVTPLAFSVSDGVQTLSDTTAAITGGFEFQLMLAGKSPNLGCFMARESPLASPR